MPEVGSVYPPDYDASITGTVVAGDGSLVLGAPGVQFGTVHAVNIYPTAGVPTAQQFGVPTIRNVIARVVGGVSSAQAFGSPKTAFRQPVGAVASAQSFGAIKTKIVFTVTGLGPASVVGTPSLPQARLLTGLSSAQQFSSSLQVNQIVHVTGLQWTLIPYLAGQYLTGQINVGYALDHGPLFGNVSIYTIVRVPVAGIASAQQFGVVKATQAVHPPGLDTAQQFGTRIGIKFRLLGVPPSSTVGKPKVFRVYLHIPPLVDVTLPALVCQDVVLTPVVCRDVVLVPSPSP
jgi:hypothetical protein